jgi:hypothetical protein
MRPRHGTPISRASVSPPPLPKMSLSVRHVGQTEMAHVLDEPHRGTLSFRTSSRRRGVAIDTGLRRRDEHGAATGKL